MPALVDRRARALQRLLDADGLHRVMPAEFPGQIVTADEAAKPGMEGADVVVLEVDLDEGLPVVVAFMDLDLVEHEARKIELCTRPQPGQLCGDIVAVVLEQQAVPFPQRVAVQVQAGVFGEVRCADQLALM